MAGVAVLVALVALVVALGVALSGMFKKAQQGGGDGGQPEALGVGVPVRPMNRAAPGGMRRRRRRAAAAAEASDSEQEEGEEEEEAEQAVRQPTKRDAYEARRAARDAEREAQEAAQEQEIRRAAEERARREAEEAQKWMHLFSVEAAGEDVLSQEESSALQARFVDYIKGRKTVGLDELAAEFRTKVQEVISRVQALEAEGALTGVMDDRGKFIFVSSEEMQAVADFIRQRGRIAIAELAHKSNQFIDLEAKATAAAELELPDAAGAGA